MKYPVNIFQVINISAHITNVTGDSMKKELTGTFIRSTDEIFLGAETVWHDVMQTKIVRV